MNIAFILQHRVLLALQSWLHLPARRSPALPSTHAGASHVCQRVTPAHARIIPPCAPAARSIPLRVRRVVECDQPLTETGRLVISGRMADVCAELDRLAAREVALR